MQSVRATRQYTLGGLLTGLRRRHTHHPWINKHRLIKGNRWFARDLYRNIARWIIGTSITKTETGFLTNELKGRLPKILGDGQGKERRCTHPNQTEQQTNPNTINSSAAATAALRARKYRRIRRQLGSARRRRIGEEGFVLC